MTQRCQRADSDCIAPDSPGAALATGHAGALAAVLGFSVLVNLLMLTGPLFMLQIYDRVLASRAGATLGALFGLVVFLHAMMAMLDHARGRVMARIGARFQARLDRRVFEAVLARLALSPADSRARGAQRDLETVQRLLSSPVFLALFDAPWTPLFVALLFAFHPELGWLALAGGAALVGMALVNQYLMRAPLAQAAGEARQAERLATQMGDESELVRALGMQGAAFGRWQRARNRSLAATIEASDRGGLLTTATRSFRLLLQSAMLALGAWLVLRDQISPGLMIAASIILGRALAPVEQLVGQWGPVQAARDSWRRLSAFLAAQPPPPPRMPLPRPRAHLAVNGLSIVPPGESRPALTLSGFELRPGRALGVIGPSGAGKSTLARVVIGAWAAAAGQVRLDGVPLERFAPEALGRLVGYLPQRVALFDGTIADNIARLDPQADPAAIVQAAERAGAHLMIAALPQGYDTPMSEQGGRLSGGQVQRIGLARALFGDPVLVVLDEPNSNLDAEGSQALNRAIRAIKAGGGAVMIMAHRPAAIQECDDLLVLDQGAQTAFGPRDEVLRQVVRNHTEIIRRREPAPSPPPTQSRTSRATGDG